MFIGHAAVGFASKAGAPRASLGWLLAAPFLLDLLWPVFVLFGLERATIDKGANPFLNFSFDSYPWSHSLAMAIVWALLYGAVVHFVTADRTAGVACALGVASHWICDAIVHRPDLPLWPGSSVYVGMGLWNSPAATLAVEVPMFAAGVWLYARATRPVDAFGRWAFAALVAVFLILYGGAAFGPPPPNMAAVAVSTLCLFAVVLPCAIWIDRHREAESDVP
ncbi:MAG TPA: hypothetical protein VMV60_00665 [Thermoanaerobaculia bacterium]|nr:hypothetical protein [Thermoanaerobaculia bacterium]